MHLALKCITIISNFSWVLQLSREKSKGRGLNPRHPDPVLSQTRLRIFVLSSQVIGKCRNVLKEISGRLQKTACNKQMSPGCVFTCEVLDRQTTTKKTNSVFLEIILFIYL